MELMMVFRYDQLSLTNHTAKHLAKMLSQLSKSECTVNKKLEFINYMKTISIPSDHKLIS